MRHSLSEALTGDQKRVQFQEIETEVRRLLCVNNKAYFCSHRYNAIATGLAQNMCEKQS